MTKLIHPDLSYQVRGALIDVHNALGPGLKEEFYRDAIALDLKERGIACSAEKPFEVYYRDQRVGLYFVDIWIEGGKMLLELKVAPSIEPLHKGQAIAYLKVTDADLAIVANYGAASLDDERLPNFLRDKQPTFDWHPHPVAEGLLYPELVNEIQKACHRVHFTLGPGFLHQVYRRATMIELLHHKIDYDYLKQLPVVYRERLLGYQDVRLIVVENKVLLAAFALQVIREVMTEQMKAHLRRLDLKLGILANFHGTRLQITPVRIA
ncbi:MAG TPA: GxxExxY protein [Chloroflexi bacterium]|nr:GxxExxY protein [Chloroflexota bacterium]